MSPLFLPLRLALLVFAGWVNRHQLNVIEYLQEENRVLKERLGGRRLRFTDVKRRRADWLLFVIANAGSVGCTWRRMIRVE
jgi:hypothetical protein